MGVHSATERAGTRHRKRILNIRHRIVTTLTFLSLMAASFAAAAAPAGHEQIDVIVVYDAIPGEAERTRTAALGARINREFANLPMRALTIPARSMDLMTRGSGVRFVAPDRQIDAVEDGGHSAAIATARFNHAAKDRGMTSDAIADMDWLVANAACFGNRAVNLSLDSRVESSDTADPLILAVKHVGDAGVAVVVAADEHGAGGEITISSADGSLDAVSVASLIDNDQGCTAAAY